MIKYGYIIYFLIIHIIALILIIKLNKSSIILNIFLFILFTFGITGCYHRLYTHQSFKAPLLVRILLIILGTGSNEDSIIFWCSLHRMHHRYENINKNLDPYSIHKYCNKNCKKHCKEPHMIYNFLWAHMAWLWHTRSPEFIKEQNKIKIEMALNEWKDDLSILIFQHKYCLILATLIGIIIPIFISKFILNDTWASSIGATTLRMCLVWHSTWLINSLAHCMGSRKKKCFTAANNHLCSIICLGEGYHNYHHNYPKDYYASEDLWCFNLTGIILYCLNKMGLIYDTKRGVPNKSNTYIY